MPRSTWPRLDLEAQRFGRIPVAYLLCDAPRSRVAVNALLFSTGVEAAAAEAARAVEAGFRTVKLKVASAAPRRGHRAHPRGARARRRGRGASASTPMARGTRRRRCASSAPSSGATSSTSRIRWTGDARAMGRAHQHPRRGGRAHDREGWRVVRARGADVLVLKPMALGGVRATRELAVRGHRRGPGRGRHVGLRHRHRRGAARCTSRRACRGRRARTGSRRWGSSRRRRSKGSIRPTAGEMQLPRGPGLGVRLQEKRGQIPFTTVNRD